MIEQDWIWGFAGGLMIGSAAAVFLLINGRIMGASGIIGGLIDAQRRANCGRTAGVSCRADRGARRYWRRLYGGAETHITDNFGGHHRRRAAGGPWHPAGQWLHLGPWRLRHFAPVAARHCGDGVLHRWPAGVTVALFRHLLGVI